jgi:hypothetical protein
MMNHSLVNHSLSPRWSFFCERKRASKKNINPLENGLPFQSPFNHWIVLHYPYAPKTFQMLRWMTEYFDFEQSQALTQPRGTDKAKSDLLTFSPELSDLMLSASEWNEFDSMLSLGIKSFQNSRSGEITQIACDPIVKPEGSLQALACILGDLKPTKDIGQGYSIFCSMNESAQKEFVSELLVGVQSSRFEVVASSLQILGHWTATEQGVCKTGFK